MIEDKLDKYLLGEQAAAMIAALNARRRADAARKKKRLEREKEKREREAEAAKNKSKNEVEIMGKIDKIMGKYIKESECGRECDSGCCSNAVYDLDYPQDVQGMIEKGWKVDRRYPTGTTIGDYACGASEYLVRFVKDGVVRWRKFQADRSA